jgi:tetratricopeptide (TPR) repeat protein
MRFPIVAAPTLLALVVTPGPACGQQPEGARAALAEALAHERAGRYEQAEAAYTRAIEAGATDYEVHNRRGMARFRLADIAGSIEDFDRAIELEPRLEPYHWQRGISYYYAERFRDGRLQFESHQTVNPNDVENGVWHFLCAVRELGLEPARERLLPISGDPRTPMREIYQLFRGEVEPQVPLGVAEAVRGGGRVDALFYANLYLGVYHEAHGDPELAKKYVTAARDLDLGHYMWAVADVHAKLRGW